MILPKNITLEKWADSLIIDFPDDNIPRLKSQDDWRPWGNSLVLEESFASNASPTTQPYSDWEKWAQAVFNAMANF